MCEWTDETGQQDTLELDQDALATQHREPKIQGSARFADDADHGEPDPGKQSNLAIEGDQNQRTLGGGTAAEIPEWSEE